MSLAEDLALTTKTRKATIEKRLREAGKTEDFIKSYIRGWFNVANRRKL